MKFLTCCYFITLDLPLHLQFHLASNGTLIYWLVCFTVCTIERYS